MRQFSSGRVRIMFASLALVMLAFVPVAHADGWCSNSATIHGLYFEWGGMTLVMNGGNQAMSCKTSCSADGYLEIPGTSPQYTDFRTMVMTALTSGSAIQFATSGCTASGRPIISSMVLWH